MCVDVGKFGIVLYLLQHHIGLRATSFCCGFCKNGRRETVYCALQLQQGHRRQSQSVSVECIKFRRCLSTVGQKTEMDVLN